MCSLAAMLILIYSVAAGRLMTYREECMQETGTSEDAALAVAEVEWLWLKPHLERGGLITVASAVDLMEAGERIAADDAKQVAEWIDSGRVGKPTAAEIAVWDRDPAKKFLMMVVSPYVLIQEIGTMN